MLQQKNLRVRMGDVSKLEKKVCAELGCVGVCLGCEICFLLSRVNFLDADLQLHVVTDK